LWGAAEVATRLRLIQLRSVRRIVDLTNAELHGRTIITAHTLSTIRCAPSMQVDKALTSNQATTLIAHYWPAATNDTASRRAAPS
jgi:hypothetical protein